MTTNIITIVRTWYIYIYHVEKAQKEVDQANTNYLTKRQNKKSFDKTNNRNIMIGRALAALPIFYVLNEESGVKK